MNPTGDNQTHDNQASACSDDSLTYWRLDVADVLHTFSLVTGPYRCNGHMPDVLRLVGLTLKVRHSPQHGIVFPNPLDYFQTVVLYKVYVNPTCDCFQMTAPARCVPAWSGLDPHPVGRAYWSNFYYINCFYLRLSLEDCYDDGRQVQLADVNVSAFLTFDVVRMAACGRWRESCS